MHDQFRRKIDYMRISITDRCNLRCQYCMPHGIELTKHADILQYEEFLQIAAAAVELGITKFKITGGEPLVRLGCVDFIRRLKKLPGVQEVTLTTNGVLLAPLVPELADIGVDGINISLDTCRPDEFQAITGTAALDKVLAGIDASVAGGIRTKLNCVLLADCEKRLIPLARFAQDRLIDVRFIEVMPIGEGAVSRGVSREQALAILQEEWPDLHAVDERRGNGPARYYASAALEGRIGMIDAVSHKFCADCNRVRITSTGFLKPCLCYSESTDLRALVRTRPEQLKEALYRAIYHKPRAHCFDNMAAITEQKGMSQIGG